MDTTAFTGFAIFVIMALVTGVIGYLAVQQGKIRRQIEAGRRQREREELAALAGVDPAGLPPDAPPVITPGTTIPGAISGAPLIEPGGTPLPHHPHPSPDGGASHGGHEAGGHPGGGSDGGHH
jgi:hypothetical protein